MKFDVKQKKIKKRLDEILYDEILNNFLKGKYLEGEEFNPVGIAEEYGVSVTPVTLTLKRMYYEQLIERTPGGKYFVPKCTVESINQLCEVRLMIEKLCVQGLMENRDEKAMQTLIQIAQKSADCLQEGDIVNSIRYDLKLHQVLVQAHGNTYLNSFYLQIRNKLLCWNYASGFMAQHQATAVQEHEEIIRAIQEGDREKIDVLLRNHIDYTRTRMLEYANIRASYEVEDRSAG